ncbi:PH domain-containing protein [Lysinibacillus xylanilyticus]|uniref:PH domain-containing protein n=1 Tax=Lysinibacillus xylanilyticus TaxID=582475 RepID=UPI002B254C84|nr:PH domain-containing protein [Lysinibacillus xylanilyticus]MEB2301816.1 PH domain-containing protein [Lysinibacillus xylanilyticus]
MFKKIAADALGLSDIGVVVAREDYDKADADDFILHEIDEKVYFLIKTKADEYCFTNRAIIHVDGESALSKKRLLRRYDYSLHNISDVFLETAGTIDLDVEINTIDNTPFSIDIHKRFINDIKDLYKALHAISYEQKQNAYKLEVAEKSLSIASSSIGRIGNDNVTPFASFEEITRFANNWMIDHKDKYKKEDFSHVFDLYVNN